MKLEAVGAVPVRRLRLQVLGQVDDGDGREGALFSPHDVEKQAASSHAHACRAHDPVSQEKRVGARRNCTSWQIRPRRLFEARPADIVIVQNHEEGNASKGARIDRPFSP